MVGAAQREAAPSRTASTPCFPAALDVCRLAAAVATRPALALGTTLLAALRPRPTPMATRCASAAVSRALWRRAAALRAVLWSAPGVLGVALARRSRGGIGTVSRRLLHAMMRRLRC